MPLFNTNKLIKLIVIAEAQRGRFEKKLISPKKFPFWILIIIRKVTFNYFISNLHLFIFNDIIPFDR